MDGPRAVWAVALVALLVQLVLGTRYEKAALFNLPERWKDYDLERVEASPDRLTAEGHRALCRLMGSLPEDARVLLVTETLASISFEYYLIPREARFLFKYDPELVAMAEARLDPYVASGFRSRFEYLEKRQMRLTAPRLKEELQVVDYVLSYKMSPGALPSEGWEVVDQYVDVAVLYRLPPRPAEGEESK